MSEQKRHSVFFISKDNPGPLPQNAIKASELKASRQYKCINHSDRDAYTLCAKCGTVLCRRCTIQIAGFHYCEECALQDDGIRETLEAEVLGKNKSNHTPQLAAPKNIQDLPHAFIDLLLNSNDFFKSAKNSPFPLSYAVAALCLIPNAIVQILFHRDKFIPDSEQFKPLVEQLNAMPDSTLVTLAILTSLIQILLLDAIFFLCLRTFAHSHMTFKETASTMHYCLVPLFFAVFGAWFDLPMISFVALGFMIILTTTATRASTDCTLLQGIGAMLSFIFITTLAGIL